MRFSFISFARWQLVFLSARQDITPTLRTDAAVRNYLRRDPPEILQ
jgi:hypothetical protein